MLLNRCLIHPLLSASPLQSPSSLTLRSIRRRQSIPSEMA